jgi:GT2 family glycosyltransferase
MTATGATEAGSATAPTVSIVVPVYNVEPYVGDSIRSILAQTYRDLEVIALDDASTDGSAEVVASFDDPRLRLVRQPRNRGIFATLNDGIALTRGSLVAFYHSDDLYDPEIVEREVAFLDAYPDVGAVFALDRFVDADGAEYARLEPPPGLRGGRLSFHEVLDNVLRRGNTFLRGQTSMVRREIYDRVGPYDERFDLRADLDMWLRIARRAPVAVIDEHLMSYRWGHSNSSARYDRLRTSPELSFSVVDAALASGGSDVASPKALHAYEARRAHDLLIVSANLYASGRPAEARALLEQAPLRRLLRGGVRRGRAAALWAILHAATRLPRVARLQTTLARRVGGVT